MRIIITIASTLLLAGLVQGQSISNPENLTGCITEHAFQGSTIACVEAGAAHSGLDIYAALTYREGIEAPQISFAEGQPGLIFFTHRAGRYADDGPSYYLMSDSRSCTLNVRLDGTGNERGEGERRYIEYAGDTGTYWRPVRPRRGDGFISRFFPTGETSSLEFWGCFDLPHGPNLYY